MAQKITQILEQKYFELGESHAFFIKFVGEDGLEDARIDIIEKLPVDFWTHDLDKPRIVMSPNGTLVEIISFDVDGGHIEDSIIMNAASIRGHASPRPPKVRGFENHRSGVLRPSVYY